MSEMTEKLLRYLVERESERHTRTDRALESLTERELMLVRDAAVMAYVRGVIFGRTQSSTFAAAEHFPSDAAIIREVMECVETFDGGYYTLRATFRGERPETREQAKALFDTDTENDA